MKRLLVTGSRDWPREQYDKIAFELGRAVAELALSDADERGRVVIVHGGAAGVDSVVEHLAKRYAIPTEVHEPEWRPHGIYNPQAGMVRNSKMVHLGFDMCLAFIHANSRGATDCATKAAAWCVDHDEAGLRVFRSTE